MSMHPDLDPFVMETGPEGFTLVEEEALLEWQEQTTKYIEEEADRLHLTLGEMSDIYYLRTRSRWTQEKEDYLIQLAKEGKPFPNIMAGEF